MKSIVLAFSFLALLAGGCTTTETVKEAKGEGITGAYAYPYDRVFDATVAAAKAKELQVVESDRKGGRVILSHGITLWSWGERVAVFVKATSANATEVEIVSKAVLAPLNFPPDWPRILLEQINTELRAGK